MPGVTKEQIQAAREADLFTYLQFHEPGVLKQDGPNFRHKEHDSLVYVTGKRYWYWNSRGRSINALDYLIQIRGYGLVDPDAQVCFAQNGYFELYGKDAEKAAPLLGTKLLEKKVRGKPSMPVTGFREAAWVAASKKLWQSGADVFLSKDGETFKELKAADYIPVGATLNVDGIKCRIDAVDFAADEVRLTNIEDKNRPIRFSESIQYIRSYVEDAGTAIYDTIPKKPAARESIRDKLRSAQKAQPPHTPKPQKNKGKDMVL